jgi:tRNA (mo5U34)-methyltransferase
MSDSFAKIAEMEEATKQAKKVQSYAELVAAQPYWYHKIALPDGTITPGWAPLDAAKYAIPDDLSGKRVLDVGAWDGYWTWEALKRGAGEVVAIDDFSDQLGLSVDRTHTWDTFDLCRKAFGFTDKRPKSSTFANSKDQLVTRLDRSVYRLSDLGTFDVVFFFGTLYHLKHPMLALEQIAAVCVGELYVESAICDDYSPYHGGIGHGYAGGQMITEFYPGAQYGDNPSNWWVPTLQSLGAMVESSGFKTVRAWPLVDTVAKDLPHCRGFAYGSVEIDTVPPNVYKATMDAEANSVSGPQLLSTAAVMSVPRLGFQDNLFCALEALVPFSIPLDKVQGAFWGQCLERGMMQAIDKGIDSVLTLDYDTVFKGSDVAELRRLLTIHPEADAIVSLQIGRGGIPVLMTKKSISGQPLAIIERTAMQGDLMQIATGHYGLTLFRTSSLLKIHHPWFLPTPDSDGLWGAGRIDDDIHLWKLMEQAGMKVFLACRVVIGHLQLMATWPNKELQPIYQHTGDYQTYGKPAEAWV